MALSSAYEMGNKMVQPLLYGYCNATQVWLTSHRSTHIYLHEDWDQLLACYGILIWILLSDHFYKTLNLVCSLMDKELLVAEATAVLLYSFGTGWSKPETARVETLLRGLSWVGQQAGDRTWASRTRVWSAINWAILTVTPISALRMNTEQHLIDYWVFSTQYLQGPKCWKSHLTPYLRLWSTWSVYTYFVVGTLMQAWYGKGQGVALSMNESAVIHVHVKDDPLLHKRVFYFWFRVTMQTTWLANYLILGF